MPKIRDFRADFRRGRTGGALQVRQDATSYQSSVRDANNMMVLADGRIAKRWGTYGAGDTPQVYNARRIVGWEHPKNNTNYLLQYEVSDHDGCDIRVYTQNSVGNLCKYPVNTAMLSFDKDLTQLTTHIDLGSSTWLAKADDIDYLNFVPVQDKLLVVDNSIHPMWIQTTGTLVTYNNAAQTQESLEHKYFEFDSNEDGTKKAPFYNFEETLTLTPNIFTIEGLSTGFNDKLNTLSQFTNGEYDLAAGTGKVTASADFFTSDHVGQNMQLLDGEFEITGITSATVASIKVRKNIAKRLDNNPFLMKKNKKTVEVSYFNHGFSKGDEIFLIGVSADDESNTVLTKALQTATDGTTVLANANFDKYTVDNVIDLDTFVITGAVNATNDALIGGNSVYCFRLGGIKGVKEEAFSKTRGWPTCAVVHERRLWMAGTTSLPNAVWASQFGDVQNFDTGEGNLTDAIAMYGVGDEAVFIRHMISGFDLVLMSDEAELYIPGSTTEAISQSTVRVVRATEHGSSFTEPAKFDGGVFFVDKNGKEIREFVTDTRITDYHSIPSSIVIPDWVKFPKKTAVFMGASENQTTPYMFFADQTDGSMICMHSARVDDSFGFMRWTLDFGKFIDVITLGEHLYALARRFQDNKYENGVLVEDTTSLAETVILRFDTDTKNYITTDFSKQMYFDSSSNRWRFPSGLEMNNYRGETLDGSNQRYQYLYSNADGGYFFKEFYWDAQSLLLASEVTGSRFWTESDHENFSTNVHLIIGDKMTAYAKLHAPIAQLPSGTRIGKKQRLVSTDVSFEGTTDGTIAGRDIVRKSDYRDTTIQNCLDNTTNGKDFIHPINEWREIHVGEWTRDPVLEVRADKTGVLIIRGMSLNVYV